MAQISQHPSISRIEASKYCGSIVPCCITKKPCHEKLDHRDSTWKIIEGGRFRAGELYSIANERIGHTTRHQPGMTELTFIGEITDCRSCLNYVLAGLNQHHSNESIPRKLLGAADPIDVSGQIRSNWKSIKDRLRFGVDYAEIIFNPPVETINAINQLKNGETLSGKVMTTFIEGIDDQKELHIFAQILPANAKEEIFHRDLLKGSRFEKLKSCAPENTGGCLFTVTRENNLLSIKLIDRSGEFGPIKVSKIAERIAEELKKIFGKDVLICRKDLERFEPHPQITIIH